ncbi:MULTISPECIES: hypothetical protein [Calothrix]|uniref:ATP-grasp domain-containing protein n=2 Tax=Calothrix TaxID=1186 RepID=A0ABR8A9F0_9CYAN|nr:MULTISPECIES: hypothetical protein [Calothrix]MBD2196488.1 hypothetical protein [Calothrix parietina FACHB-288]MBD2224617.1 hypothetical protein [Calothrix anomala FACHB-343]
MELTKQFKELLPKSIAELFSEYKIIYRTYYHWLDKKDVTGIIIIISYIIRITIVNFFLARKTILFYPDKPYPGTVIYKICLHLGYSITNDPTKKFDLAFKWQDSTFSQPDNFLQKLAARTEVFNINCNDISKNHVDKIFKDIFGYSSLVDPFTFKGKIVRKSNMNATHDGKIIDAPLEETESGYLYQKLIHNEVDENFVQDIRVTIFKDKITYLALKYRPIQNRFNIKSYAKISAPEEIFTQEEIKKIINFARTIGLDYGDLDILRDREDNKIYIIDANNTPWGLNSDHMSKSLEKIALTKLSKSFKIIFIDSKTNACA